MKFKNRSILLISNECWDGTWYSKHHYAIELAKNNKVFFLNPPEGWKFAHLFSRSIKIDNVSGNLFTITYSSVLPFSVSSEIFRKLNEWIVIPSLNRVFRKHNFLKPVFWSFDPFRFSSPNAFDAVYSIYQSMDFYSVGIENKIAENVNLVIAVTEGIQNRLSKFKSKLIRIPHGIPGSLVNRGDLSGKGRTKSIFLAATLNFRIDFSLLLQIAKRFSDYELCIAGRITQKGFTAEDMKSLMELRTLTNVNFAGDLKFEEIFTKMCVAGVCINTYKLNKEGNQSGSLKILQYLISGSPVVSTWLQSYSGNEESSLIWNTKTSAEFIASLHTVLSGPFDEREAKRRADYASRFTYSGLIEIIEEQSKF